MKWFALTALAALLVAAAPPPAYDLVIRGGTIYDGSGGVPFVGDVAIKGERVMAVGTVAGDAARVVDARGLAVAPGFINMLSWANESLIADGRSMSDVKQGVTLEVMGEGWSMGPLTPKMRADALRRQGDIRYPITWTTLAQYLEFLTKKGISPNVASFVGATTVRIHELGEDDVQPTPAQLARMQALVRAAMNDGALGVGSSLIYTPATYAKTPELTALMKAAAPCGGRYISHIRNESDDILGAIDELVSVVRDSGARGGEIYHLKQAGRENWDKLPAVVARVAAARAQGLDISADMYTYTAGATGLDAAMPPWVQAGGVERWVERLKDPATRARVAAEMRAPGRGWENLLLQAGGPENVLFLEFKNPALKKYNGRTLAAVATERGRSPEDTAIDLVIEDGSRVGVAYFLMNEENVARQTALPWMAFGSDAASQAPEGVFLRSSAHPRAYGNVARLLGRYVRDERRLTLQEAVRRLTSFPAANLGLTGRGRLAPGYQADVVVFDPARIADRATYAQPQQYAVGMVDVFVNGVQVLKGGEHTGALPGQVVKGPGAGRCPQVQ